MIAKISGKIDSILEDSLIIETSGGISYQVFVSSKTLNSVKINTNITIKTQHIFRQEQQFLCGFNTNEELTIFKSLQDVQGVGVKSALSVLSTLSTTEFALAVVNQNTETLCKAHGIGKKTAERILLELKGKNLAVLNDIQTNNDNSNDAILGLISLGYPKNQVIKIVSDVLNTLDNQAPTNEIIVQCLHRLNQKK